MGTNEFDLIKQSNAESNHVCDPIVLWELNLKIAFGTSILSNNRVGSENR
jgi:hypothetical protein